MSKRAVLRLISLAMLIAAVIFVLIAISDPTLGRTIYIGSFKFGYRQWQMCYVVYVIVMIGLFVSSFFVKKK